MFDKKELEQIKQTKDRWEETTLQQTPMSIVAFSGEKLQEIGATRCWSH